MRIDPPKVTIDLSRVRKNALDIAARVGVPVIAVIKANAYGLGAKEVVRAIADVVSGFYCFTLREAIEADTAASGKPAICLVGDDDETVEAYKSHNVRPAVWDAERAARLRGARPVLCVDTGMQRFACPPELIDNVLRAGECDEAFTHATTIEQVEQFKYLMSGRSLRLHAAATLLLDQPAAYLDAVRPGLALYDGAVRVEARLIEARDTRGPIGYHRLTPATARHGVIIGGYSNGLRPGPCLVNGERRRIIECGMQSSFVELGPRDAPGDSVTLLTEALPLRDIATEWGCSAQQVLVSFCRRNRCEFLP